jgi:hypothetical protein
VLDLAPRRRNFEDGGDEQLYRPEVRSVAHPLVAGDSRNSLLVIAHRLWIDLLSVAAIHDALPREGLARNCEIGQHRRIPNKL